MRKADSIYSRWSRGPFVPRSVVYLSMSMVDVRME